MEDGRPGGVGKFRRVCLSPRHHFKLSFHKLEVRPNQQKLFVSIISLGCICVMN